MVRVLLVVFFLLASFHQEEAKAEDVFFVIGSLGQRIYVRNPYRRNPAPVFLQDPRRIDPGSYYHPYYDELGGYERRYRMTNFDPMYVGGVNPRFVGPGGIYEQHERRKAMLWRQQQYLQHHER